VGTIDYFNTFIDIIYPRQCFACDKPIEDNMEKYVCRPCLGKIKIGEDNRCVRCGLSLGQYADKETFGCILCKDLSLWFDSVHCVGEYAGIIKELIHKFKYGRNEVLHITLGGLLVKGVSCVNIMNYIDLVVPVPLFWTKRLKRRFNQSELISKELAKYYSLPHSKGNLRRIRATETQTKLTRNQRIANVKGAFNVRKPGKLTNKRILLVDDVMTTGMTTSECARILKENGACRVEVLVLGRSGSLSF